MKFNFFKDYFKTTAKFIQKPKLVFEYDEDGENFYSLDSDLIFWSGKKQIVIQKNLESGAVFITNLVSYPKWLRLIAEFLKKTGLFSLVLDRIEMVYPSILHDGMYTKPNFFQRVYADWIFLLALKVEKEKFFIRWSAFILVRLFGSSYRS